MFLIVSYGNDYRVLRALITQAQERIGGRKEEKGKGATSGLRVMQQTDAAVFWGDQPSADGVRVSSNRVDPEARACNLW